MKYKIIWIDDQHEDQEGFKTEAEQEDIELVCFKTSKTGMEELEKNIYKYDGVLLDAKVFNESEDETPKLNGLTASISKLDSLNHRKIFPYFVFTGQPDLKDNGMFEDMLNGKASYYKGDDNQKLFDDIKAAADQQIQTQIKHTHKRVFDVCTEEYIGENAAKDLLEILETINTEKELRPDLYLNRLRQILEYVFRAANQRGFLHDKCIPNGRVNLTASSLFMAGIPVDLYTIHCAKIHFPKIIATNVKNILEVTNLASHTERREDIEISQRNFETYQQVTNSPYLLYSLTYQLMDVLLWFKQYADNFPDVEDNKNYWSNNSGIIEQDERGNYYCDKFLIASNLVDGHRGRFNLNDFVVITSSSENMDSRTKNNYPFFASRLNRSSY